MRSRSPKHSTPRVAWLVNNPTMARSNDRAPRHADLHRPIRQFDEADIPALLKDVKDPLILVLDGDKADGISHWGGVLAGDHHEGATGTIGAAYTGTEIMRILDAIEDQDQRVLDVLEEGRDVGFVELTNRPVEVGVTRGAIVAPGHGRIIYGPGDPGRGGLRQSESR